MKTNTKIVYKKLRTVWGWANVDENKIELYHKLKGKKHLEILLHEKFHILLPDYEEKSIRKISKDFCNLLWSQGYRVLKGSPRKQQRNRGRET